MPALGQGVYNMVSDAQKKAAAKYHREKTQMRGFRFGPNDKDVLEWLDAQPNKAGYIKRLIREDMKRNGKA